MFEDHSIGRLIAAHLGHAPPELTTVRSDVPFDLAAVIHRCLAKDRADRFADVAALDLRSRVVNVRPIGLSDLAAIWWQSRTGAYDAPELLS